MTLCPPSPSRRPHAAGFSDEQESQFEDEAPTRDQRLGVETGVAPAFRPSHHERRRNRISVHPDDARALHAEARLVLHPGRAGLFGRGDRPATQGASDRARPRVQDSTLSRLSVRYETRRPPHPGIEYFISAKVQLLEDVYAQWGSD